MKHLKILGYIACVIAMFVVLFIAVPALISAKSTVAVVAGFALVLAALYLLGAFLHGVFQDLNNPENKETE